jgi:UDP-GlcNAc:undecaprenyl-phosphate GlcNAc-1-phosphate transferase
MTYLYPPVIALATLLTSLLTLPLYMAIARRAGIIDHPGSLKIHQIPTPLIGGAAILTGFATAILLAVGPELHMAPVLAWLCAAATGIWVLGLVDDVHPLSPWTRLVGQSVAAVTLIQAGFLVMSDAPWWLTGPVTFLLLVGLSNAMNLLDGMDGLATGVGCLSALGLAAASTLLGNVTAFLLCVFFACALLGVLAFNWHPARVFLGSNGALLIGFVLGAIVVALAQTPMVLGGLLCIVGLPILDTGTAIVTRLRTGAPLFQGDRNHLYDRLARRGFSTRQTVGFCYLLTLILIAVGLAVIHLGLPSSLPTTTP